MQTRVRAFNSTDPSNYEIDKAKFTDKFWNLLDNEIENDGDYKRIIRISNQLRTKSREFVKEAIRRSIVFEFRPTGEPNKHSVVMKIKMNLIKDMFANGLDNVVVGEARKKADGSPHLRLISEMQDLTGQISWAFNYYVNDCRIGSVRPAQLDRADKTKALCRLMEKILFKLETNTERELGVQHGQC